MEKPGLTQLISELILLLDFFITMSTTIFHNVLEQFALMIWYRVNVT